MKNLLKGRSVLFIKNDNGTPSKREKTAAPPANIKLFFIKPICLEVRTRLLMGANDIPPVSLLKLSTKRNTMGSSTMMVPVKMIKKSLLFAIYLTNSFCEK